MVTFAFLNLRVVFSIRYRAYYPAPLGRGCFSAFSSNLDHGAHHWAQKIAIFCHPRFDLGCTPVTILSGHGSILSWLFHAPNCLHDLSFLLNLRHTTLPSGLAQIGTLRASHLHFHTPSFHNHFSPPSLSKALSALTVAHKIPCPASSHLQRPSFKIPRNPQKNPLKGHIGESAPLVFLSCSWPQTAVQEEPCFGQECTNLHTVFERIDSALPAARAW